MENVHFLSDMEICRRLGERLRYIRLRKNITQDPLADMCRLSVTTIKRMESGTQGSFDSFLRVIRMLGLLEDFAMFVEEEKPTPSEEYEFQQSRLKRMRKRANGNYHKPQKIKDSEW